VGLLRIVGSIAVVVSVIVVVSGCSSGASPSAPPSESPAGERGPSLEGTYRVDVGNFITDDGKELPKGAGTFDLVARSACKDGACVAIAAAPNAREPGALQAEVVAADLVLDYIDGRWVAVETWTGKCKPVGRNEEMATANWDSFVLEPNPDGTLTGAYTGRGVLETCAGSTHQRITMTRTGNADPQVPLPDPAAQPPRQPTPASGFRGRYDYTSVNVTADVPPGTPGSPKMKYTADTVCLRTGDRCLTYLLTKEGYSRALVFADGKWTETSAPFPGRCQPDGTATKVRHGEFPLPQRPTDPIPVVHGRVREEAVDGPCAGVSQFDNTLTRTGD
jgi:serine/threonine-protein kinase